jgi:hypothetical protein
MSGSGTGASVFAATLRIVNEEGAWRSTSFGGRFADGTAIGHGPVVFIGEGAYKGLIAVATFPDVEGVCASDIRGIIVEGAPAGEPYVPE